MLILKIQVCPKPTLCYVQIINEITKNRLEIHQFDSHKIDTHPYQVLALSSSPTFQCLDMAKKKYIHLMNNAASYVSQRGLLKEPLL